MKRRNFTSRSVFAIVFLVLAFNGCKTAGTGNRASPPSHRIEVRVGQNAYSYEDRLHYLMYIPPAYLESPTQRWPLILFLHGMGERGDSADTVFKVAKNGLPKIIASGVDMPFIVVSPQCHTTGYWDPHFEDILGLLEEIKDSYSIDEGRIYLTGLSMGGFGAWELVALHPELFAAAAPVAGGYTSSRPLERLSALKQLPLWVFHGAYDDVVPPAQDEELVAKLKALDGNVRYTLYPDAGHNLSWEKAYADPELYAWFLRNTNY